jgi:hypothetical protein
VQANITSIVDGQTVVEVCFGNFYVANQEMPDRLLQKAKMLDTWITDLLADPISKSPSTPERIGITDGIVDARRFLRNTIGYNLWDEGQSFYENWEQRTIEDYQKEVAGVAPVYQHIRMSGRVLDVGGGAGSVSRA